MTTSGDRQQCTSYVYDGELTASYLYGLGRIAGTAGKDTLYYGTDVRSSVRSGSGATLTVLA